MDDRQGRALFLGIDEAGYGPNLGPLVVASIAIEGPQELAAADWWTLAQPAIGRAGSGSPWIIDDSKCVLAGRRGFEALCRTAQAVMASLGEPGGDGPIARAQALDLATLFQRFDMAGASSLCREHWYPESGVPGRTTWFADGPPRYGVGAANRAAQPTGPARLAGPTNSTRKPCRAPAGPVRQAKDGDAPTLPDALAWGGLLLREVRTHVVFPAEFNRRLDSLASKASLELELVAGLLAWHVDRAERSVQATIDRLGGRRYYRRMLEEIAEPAFLQTIEESRNRSVYRFGRPPGEVEIGFQVQADRTSLPVALASMVAKYLRERCMAAFNAFWCARVKGLAPTAGYPGDARRFLDEIEREPLGIPREQIWREK